MNSINSDSKILIVGLGLMGGSYARALSNKGYGVRAISLDQKSIDYAVEGGFLEGGWTEVCDEALDWAELIVFALYPTVFVDWIEKNGHRLRPGTLITDVTGVKSGIVERVQDMLPAGVEFISAHPMAGRERSGVEYSDERVFAGANYIVVPTSRNTPEAIELCRQLGRELGFLRISVLDSASHDRMIAFLSQLTHAIAVALMCSNDTPGFEAYTGDSFRDLTRIARINDEMWSELFLLNRDALLSEMDNFMEHFAAMRQALADGDRDAMRDMMRLSGERREKFDKPRV